MNPPVQIILFSVADHRFAFLLNCVRRVMRAVEIAPLAGAPNVALGVINMNGAVLPVLGIRKRLGLPNGGEVKPSDHFIIAQMSHGTTALLVDEVHGVASCDPATMTAGDQILGGLHNVEGVMRLPDGLVIVQDLDRFLSLEEERVLQEALERENKVA